jgi:hypothetical protein
MEITECSLGGRKPTYLQLVIPVSQEHRHRPAHCVPCIPSSIDGLLKRGVHRVLHAPNVVANAVWRKLSSHYTRMWPGARARARDDAVCCGEEVVGVLE